MPRRTKLRRSRRRVLSHWLTEPFCPMQGLDLICGLLLNVLPLHSGIPVQVLQKHIQTLPTKMFALLELPVASSVDEPYLFRGVGPPHSVGKSRVRNFSLAV